jgi:cytochrome c
MKVILTASLSVALLVSSPVFADQALASKNGCMACHGIDKKLVGPSFQDIAKKYAGDASAAAKLSEKIKAGGKGAWGPIPMPPHPQINDGDRLKLATWALAGGK